jgi:hypothetical protein
MSTEIAKVDYSQLPSTQVGTDAAFDDLAKGGDFLGRLQLFTKGKAIDRGLIKPGHYGIPVSEDEVTDLGDSIDLLVIARRPKAIDMTDKEAIIVVHDHESAEFQRIAVQSNEKESHCMYGPSFLVYERTTGKFYEFFCGSKSTRTEAKKIYPFMPVSQADIKSRNLTDVEPHGPLPMTLKSRYIEKGSYSWHVPVVQKCSVPFKNEPPAEAVIKEIGKFLTFKDGEQVEKVTEPEGGKKKRAR